MPLSGGDVADILNFGGATSYAASLDFGVTQKLNQLNFSNTAGTVTIDAATVNDILQFNSSGAQIALSAAGNAIVSAPISMNAGLLLSNTSTGTLTVSGSITNGANLLTIGGSGAVVLSGNIVGGTAGGITITNTGVTTISGNNTNSGATTLSNGTLNINSAGALGGGGNLVLGASAVFNNTSGATVVLTGNSPVSISANSTFLGTNDLTFGTGTWTVSGTSRTVTVNASTLTIGGGISAGSTFSFTKAGAGKLTVNGAISLSTGNLVVSGGTLNIVGGATGSSTATILSYGATAATTIVNVSSNISLYSTTGSNVAGSIAVYNQTAGTVAVNGVSTTNNLQYVAGGAGYGFMNISGGSYSTSLRFNVTGGSTVTGAPTGVVYLSGGSITNSQDFTLISFGEVSTLGSLTIAGTGVFNQTNSAAIGGLPVYYASSSAVGALNLAGPAASLNIANQIIYFGAAFGAPSNTNAIGFVNLAAGTLTTKGFGVGTTVQTGNFGYINLAGGTIKSSMNNTLVPTAAAATTVITTVFGAIDNSAVAGAPSFLGGVTFDTNGFNQTVGTVIKGAASSMGVTQANIGNVLTASGNSGYVGAPFVQFTVASGGVVAGGTPASGYALISGGQVSGIVITDPGTYSAGSTVTITLTGGGGTIAPITTSALNTSNTAGGLTKIGAGTLILSAANTYTGNTTVQAGTLTLSGSGSIATSPSIIVGDTSANSAASLTVSAITFNVASGQTLKGYGSVTGSVSTPIAILSGGIVQGGNGSGALTVVGNLTINQNAQLRTDVDTGTLLTAGNTGANSSYINFNTAAVRTLALNPNASGTFSILVNDNGLGITKLQGSTTYVITLAQLGTNGILTDRTGTVTASAGGTLIDPTHYILTSSNFSPGVDFASSRLEYFDAGSSYQLRLIFTTTPEPHHLLLVCSAVLAVGLLIRRRLRPTVATA